MLGDGETFGINERFGALHKKFSINLVKQRKNFA